jgi:hypothetical protein
MPAIQIGDSTGLTSRSWKRKQRPARLGAARTAICDRGRDCELRPAVYRLPDEPRRPERERDTNADPRPMPTHQASRACDHDPDAECDQQERDQRLIQQRHPGDDPSDRQHPRLFQPHGSRDQPRNHRPSKQIERGRAQKVPNKKCERSRSHASGRDELGSMAASQLPRERTRHHHRHANHQRRWDPQSPQRPRCDAIHDVRDERRQRPLIGITPGQMIPGCKEVKLVAVIAIPTGTHDQRERDETSEEEQALSSHGRLYPQRPWHTGSFTHGGRASATISSRGRNCRDLLEQEDSSLSPLTLPTSRSSYRPTGVD